MMGVAKETSLEREKGRVEAEREESRGGKHTEIPHSTVSTPGKCEIQEEDEVNGQIGRCLMGGDGATRRMEAEKAPPPSAIGGARRLTICQ